MFVVVDYASFAETDSSVECLGLGRDSKHVVVAVVVIAVVVAAAFEIFALVEVNLYSFRGDFAAVDDAENEYCSLSFERVFFPYERISRLFVYFKKVF